MNVNPISRSCQHGMTLLEVLVAVLILAIGLLGIAGLQSRGQAATAEASVRTHATILANELLDRMRINRSQSQNGGYAFTSAPTASVNCRVNSCSTTRLRNFDIADWLTQVNTILPGGTAVSTYSTGASAVNRGRYEVAITWNVRDSERDDPTGTAGMTKTMTWVMSP
jgi:type IV pilus assembly protein PilV